MHPSKFSAVRHAPVFDYPLPRLNILSKVFLLPALTYVFGPLACCRSSCQLKIDFHHLPASLGPPKIGYLTESLRIAVPRNSKTRTSKSVRHRCPEITLVPS